MFPDLVKLRLPAITPPKVALPEEALVRVARVPVFVTVPPE